MLSKLTLGWHLCLPPESCHRLCICHCLSLNLCLGIKAHFIHDLFFFPLTLRILVTHFTVPFYGFLQVLWLISRYLLMCCFGCATFNIITGFQFLVNKKWTPSSQQLLFIEPLQQDIFHTWLNPTKKLSLFLIHKWKMEAERVEEAWPVVLGKWQSWGVSLSLLCWNTYHSHLYWSV